MAKDTRRDKAAVTVEVTKLVPTDLIPFADLKRWPARFTEAAVIVEDAPARSMEKALDVERQVLDWWETKRGEVWTAALSRLAFRIAASVGTAIGVKEGTGNSLLGEAAGWLTGLTLTELDTPDTRCWSLLPRDIFIQRRSVPPGTHTVTVVMKGPRGTQATAPKSVTVEAGTVAFAVFVTN